MATPTNHRIIVTAKFQVFTAVSPTGRIMQLWAKPDGYFPEHIATDFPDPDTTTTCLVFATDSFSEASRVFADNASVMFTHSSAIGCTVHTINDPESTNV